MWASLVSSLYTLITITSVADGAFSKLIVTHGHLLADHRPTGRRWLSCWRRALHGLLHSTLVWKSWNYMTVVQPVGSWGCYAVAKAADEAKAWGSDFEWRNVKEARASLWLLKHASRTRPASGPLGGFMSAELLTPWVVGGPGNLRL